MTGELRRSLKVYCADIGSIAGGKFGWAAKSRDISISGTSIEELALSVAHDLDADSAVALGFECPLFVPIVAEPSRLGCARDGEGARPWSANAGASSLATGLVQVAWLLGRIKAHASGSHHAHLDWAAFATGYRGLFLWEAFVSGTSKRGSHVDDAAAAVDAFYEALPDPRSCVRSADAYSLVGAALLRTGWTADVAILSEPCLVIRAAAHLS